MYFSNRHEAQYDLFLNLIAIEVGRFVRHLLFLTQRLACSSPSTLSALRVNTVEPSGGKPSTRGNYLIEKWSICSENLFGDPRRGFASGE